METSHSRHHRFELLLKEIDHIHSTIKNLDDIIYKTKNFAILLWGGSLYLIAENLKTLDNVNNLIFLTAIIPVIFWAMHFRWQKHLSMCSQRERMISFFINSTAFEKWIGNDASIRFPLYDIPGWIYTNKASAETKEVWKELGVAFDDQYLLDAKAKELRFWKLLLYKDAKWYYSIMFIISIIFGILYKS